MTIGLFVALLFLASIGADMLGALVGFGGSNGEAVILLGLLVLLILLLGLVGIDA